MYILYIIKQDLSKNIFCFLFIQYIIDRHTIMPCIWFPTYIKPEPSITSYIYYPKLSCITPRKIHLIMVRMKGGYAYWTNFGKNESKSNDKHMKFSDRFG